MINKSVYITLQSYIFYLSFLQYFGDGMASDRCSSKQARLLVGENSELT